MRTVGAILVLIAALVAAALPVMTGLGSRRRGSSVPVAVVAALFFPITWASWYVRDEHPYRRTSYPVA